jgi:SET domain-containing protein
MFATAPIKKGTFIAQYSGKVIPNKIADDINSRYLFELNNRWTVDGSSRKNIARYINHSCRPNAEVYIVRHAIKIRARRKITEGEEITYDYGRNYFNTFLKPVGCKCDKCVEKRREERRQKRSNARRRRRRAMKSAPRPVPLPTR